MISKEGLSQNLEDFQKWQSPPTGPEIKQPLGRKPVEEGESKAFPLEERARLWVEFEKFSNEEKRRFYQADGFFALHACTEPEDVLASGKLLSNQDQNIAAGRDPNSPKKLYSSKAVHFSLNTVYFTEDRLFGRIPDDPISRKKWFYGDSDDRQKVTIETQRAGFLVHPGMLMTRKLTSENGLHLASPINEDLAVRDKHEGEGIPTEWTVFLAPKNQSVDPATGLPSAVPTKEQWQLENSQRQDGDWYHNKTGIVSFPPEKFSITAEQYWVKKLEEVKAQGGQAPEVFFYNGLTFEEGIAEWRKEWNIPDPDLNKFKETLALFGQEEQHFSGNFASGGGRMYTASLNPEAVGRVLEANQ